MHKARAPDGTASKVEILPLLPLPERTRQQKITTHRPDLPSAATRQPAGICCHQKKPTKKPPLGVASSSQPAVTVKVALLVEDVEQECLTWHRPIFSGGDPPTIVGAAAFHNRVRDGSEWFHCAMDTRIELASHKSLSSFILRFEP